jgi:hypothetical protein
MLQEKKYERQTAVGACLPLIIKATRSSTCPRMTPRQPWLWRAGVQRLQLSFPASRKQTLCRIQDRPRRCQSLRQQGSAVVRFFVFSGNCNFCVSNRKACRKDSPFFTIPVRVPLRAKPSGSYEYRSSCSPVLTSFRFRVAEKGSNQSCCSI